MQSQKKKLLRYEFIGIITGAKNLCHRKQMYDLHNLKERKWAVFGSSFHGDFPAHYGIDKMLDWINQIIDKDPTSKQRTQWRKEHKEQV